MGLQVLLSFVLVFVDYSDESGNSTVDHETSSASSSSSDASSSSSPSSPAVAAKGATHIAVTKTSPRGRALRQQQQHQQNPRLQPLLSPVDLEDGGIGGDDLLDGPGSGRDDQVDDQHDQDQDDSVRDALASLSSAAPTSIEFRSLSYSVSTGGGCSKKKKGSDVGSSSSSSSNNNNNSSSRLLLKDIHGYARAGCMTALMGPSGAGKSTLLDVLANKKTGGRTCGDMLVNGARRDDRSFPRISGYVEQSDSHYPTMTVREAVLFSATLRLPASMSRRAKERRTDHVLRELLLTPFKDDLIGDDVTPGVSPEVRKKVGTLSLLRTRVRVGLASMQYHGTTRGRTNTRTSCANGTNVELEHTC